MMNIPLQQRRRWMMDGAASQKRVAKEEMDGAAWCMCLCEMRGETTLVRMA
jgi:hypothetical protein